MDKGFKAKYKVLQKVFGEFASDTIEFIAYDHYGLPEFSKYQNVLLFVSEDSGHYYHKSIYSTMFIKQKTDDGQGVIPNITINTKIISIQS